MQLRATSNETSSSATIPPKRTPTLCTRHNGCAGVDSAIRAPQLLFASCQTQHVRRMSQFALDCLAERESAGALFNMMTHKESFLLGLCTHIATHARHWERQRWRLSAQK